jgi:hypothetical protein
MTYAVRALTLTFFLALLPAVPAFTQTQEVTPKAAAAPVANVYIQTQKGVNVYDANAAGQLTALTGSPFTDSGQMEAINGKYLFSVGTDDVHAYTIASSGAVGDQASVANTQDYGGSECGATSYYGTANGSVLDHTGKYLYLELYNDAYEGCAAWQSYQVGTNGSLTFLGDFEDEADTSGNVTPSTVPTISSNDNFEYAAFQGYTGFTAFKKSSTGEMEINSTFTEVDPESKPGSGYGYEPYFNQADPSGHLASLMWVVKDDGFGGRVGLVLASYSINATTGNIVSTNTYENMPIPAITNPTAMSMSPSGKLLAVAGAPGLQIFHFNGASPITTYSSLLLPTVDIDQLAWDNNDHLFALSYETAALYVYTVTPTSISEVSGSPYKVANAYGVKGLIVVPK